MATAPTSALDRGTQGSAVVGPRAALKPAIRTVRADNPFLPVAVVAPNHLLGAWLSRPISADTGHTAIDIDFMLAQELAWRVAAPGLLRDGRAHVPENVGPPLLLGAIPEATAHADIPDDRRATAGTARFEPAALRTIDDTFTAKRGSGRASSSSPPTCPTCLRRARVIVAR